MKRFSWLSLLALAAATLTFDAAAQTSLNPTADAYVRDGTYAGSNFGSSTVLQTKTTASTSYNRDSYFKFDLSSVASVSSAKLRIYANLSGTGNISIAAYPVTTTTWSESTLTWNNRPARGTTSIGSASVNSTSYAWYELDVTSYAQSEKAAGRNVISLALHNPSNSDPNINLNSREASANKPVLVVTASASNVAPTVSITSPAAGTTYTAPASIGISANAADSDGTVSKVEFFAGSTALGTDTTAPYGATWNAVAVGVYSLTARATDNGNASTTSGAVSVEVKSVTPSCGSASGGPTDNPVAAKYGATAYAWTDNIKWSCVHNINDYSGGTIIDKFNSARDAAAAAGGGVVYLPSGTYNFSDSIVLKNGVVLRGGTPTSADAKVAGYNPPTTLEFPKYNPSLSGSGTPNSTAFKSIKLSTNSDSHTGVVNVSANRVSIKLSASEGVVLFGIRNNNSAEPDPGVPASWQNAWQRWSYRFNYNLSGTASKNVLIANNRINDAITDTYDQPGFLVKNGTTTVTLTSGTQAQFNYANHYGINARASETATGIVVRDNWVFHTMRVAIYAKGEGLVIKDNIVRDEDGKVAWVDPTGQRLVGNSATLENRAIDFAGFNVVITGNDYEVRRHKLKDTIYGSVDGEGILAQECCGGTLVKGLTVSNNFGPNPTYIGLYKTREIKDVIISNNTVIDGSFGIFVMSNTNGANYPIDNTKVTGNNVRGPIQMLGDVATTLGGNTIQNNVNPDNNGQIKHSCEASASISGNSGFTVNACQ